MTAAVSSAALALLAVFLLPAAGAGALTMDLGGAAETETLSVAISGEGVNRLEFPETVLNAFTSSPSMDVRIAGKSALVRTGEEAELVVLTEKRRLTLLLVPEDGPSRTVILRAPAEAPSPPEPGGGESGGGAGARERERAAVGLVLSLLRQKPPPEAYAAPRAAVGGGLFLSAFASAEDGDFSAEAYLVENGGRRDAALSEAAPWSGPDAAAVWTEKRSLRPGESSRAVVVRRREAGR